MKNKSIVVISLIVLIGLFMALVNFYKEDKKVDTSSLNNNEAPFVRAHSTVYGENKKNVTVVEFMDPECEACGYFHAAMKELYRQYYEDIKIVIRYLDNHKNSKFVVKILESAKKQNKYHEALEKIFDTQNKWAIHNNEKPELLWEILKEVDGLDIIKLKNDVKSIDVDELLKIDRKDAQTLNVRGTPTIFVNGIKLDRLSPNSLIDLVESEIYK